MRKRFFLAFFLVVFSGLVFADSAPPVPDGCVAVFNAMGVPEVSCEFEKQEFEGADIVQDANSCGGVFEIVGGVPTCVTGGQHGFSGSVVCPDAGALAAAESSCAGTAERLTGVDGCTMVVCRNGRLKEEFDRAIEEKFGDSAKAGAIQCAKDGGTAVPYGGGIKCVGAGVGTVGVKEELGAITQQEISGVGVKLERLEAALEQVPARLDALQESYAREGKTQQAETVLASIIVVEGVRARLAALDARLQGELTVDERKSLVLDLRQATNEVRQAASYLLKGRIPSKAEIQEEAFKQMSVYYHTPFGTKAAFEAFKAREKDALARVRECVAGSFEPPDPERLVVSVDIVPGDGVCTMILTDAQGGRAEFKNLSKQVYSNFAGPESLLAGTCSGNCQIVQMISQKVTGSTDGEQCMTACIRRDCVEGSQLSCMTEERMRRCEESCGFKKDGGGPFGKGGSVDDMQACVVICVQRETGRKDVRCQPGGQDAVCNACEKECTSAYGAGAGFEHCLTEPQTNAKKAACESQGKYASPVESSTPDGKSCISDFACKDYPSAGDNPGSGSGVVV